MFDCTLVSELLLFGRLASRVFGCRGTGVPAKCQEPVPVPAVNVGTGT